MNGHEERERLASVSTRELIHRRLDGPVSADEASELERRLTASAEARALYEELAALQSELSRLPRPRFPREALAEILQRTAGRAPQHRRGGTIWRAAALVAAIVLAAGVLVAVDPTRSPAPHEPAPDPRVRRALVELEMVFRVADRKIRSAERHAVSKTMEELGGDLRPALEKIPLLGTGLRSATERN